MVMVTSSAARCDGGPFGIALVAGGCWFAGARPNDGADVEAELDEAAVCIGLANVGAVEGVLARRGDGKRPLTVLGGSNRACHGRLCWRVDHCVQLMPIPNCLMAIVSLVDKDVRIISVASERVT